MSTNETAPAEFRVLLANRGNPNHAQDPDKPLPGAPADAFEPVKDLLEASAVCQRYIAAHSLGAGNWEGGRVDDAHGAYVARVAYNGRVFAAERVGGLLLHEAAKRD